MNQILQVTDNLLLQLETIVADGNSIIEIQTPHGLRYFIYSSIEFSYTSSSTSITYNTFKGIEITPFIFATRDTAPSRAYLQSIQRFLEGKEFVNVRFNQSIPYFTFTQ